MFYVFRLGPLETKTEWAHVYLGLDVERGLCPPVFEQDDAKALRALAAQVPAGVARVCEPRLADAGRAFGFTPGPAPDAAVSVRASMAIGLALGPLASNIHDPGIFLELADATATYVEAAPWRHRDGDTPLDVTLSGALAGHFECSVLGHGGETFGLALYPGRGAVARLTALVEQGRMADAAGVESFAVTLDEKPAFAVEALREAFGLSSLPVPAHVRKGKAVPVTEAEVVALAAALRAVVELTDDGATATGVAAVGACSVSARIDASRTAASERPPPPTLRAARNAPCPCGSGKKYKKCHLPLDEVAHHGADGSSLHLLDERLTSGIFQWASRRLGMPWLDGVRATYPASVDLDPVHLQLLVPWAVYEYRLGERTAAERYLAERGSYLAASERAWIAAQRQAWLSIWEVQSVDPGTSVVVRDLLTGALHTVREHRGSQAVTARSAMLARVVEAESEAVFCGAHPSALGPRDAAAVVTAVRRALRLGSGVVPVARLREPGASEALLGRWQARVDQATDRPPPRLTNTDGDPLLLTTDRFDIAEGGVDEVERRIAALDGAEADEAEGGVTRFTITRPGNPMHRSWENTIVGTITVSGARLQIETNSLPRADALRITVEAACAGLVTHRVRSHTDPVAELRLRPPAAVPPRLPIGEDAGRALRAWKEQHYTDWLDEPIPALRGATPREAARSPGHRRALAVLLKEIEHGESTLPAAERFDVGILRERLGIGDEP